MITISALAKSESSALKSLSTSKLPSPCNLIPTNDAIVFVSILVALPKTFLALLDKAAPTTFLPGLESIIFLTIVVLPVPAAPVNTKVD